MQNQGIIKFLWRGLILLFALGFLTVLIPVPPLEPLVQRDEWILRGGVFENSKPDLGNIDPSILGDWRSRYFRTWSPQGGASADAEIRTPLFAPPGILVIPLVGYPAEKNLQLDLVCAGTGKIKTIAYGNAHEIWAQKIMIISPGWCPGAVQLIAGSKSATYYIGMGTPYAGNLPFLLKHSLLSLVFLHGFAFLLLLLPIVAITSFARRLRFPEPIAWLTAVSVFGLLAYGQFFLIQWSRSLGSCLGLALYAWSGYQTFVLFVGRAGDIREKVQIDWKIKVAYLFSLSMFLLLEAADMGVGAWNAAYRFLPAVWSSDHLLPRIVAEGLYALKPLPDILGGTWHVSDRPPLMSGLQLLAQPLLQLLQVNSSSSTLYHFMPKLFGIITAGAVVVPVTITISRMSELRSIDARFQVWALLLILYSPFVIFNTIYTWPKLITAFLVMLGVLVLCIESIASVLAVLIAGVLFGLALLAHAGTAFGLLALPLFVRALSGRWSLVKVMLSGIVTVLCWTPWAVWQRLVDPPGNALAKFALTGSFGFTEQAKSLGVAVAEAYHGMSLSKWFAMKLLALKNLLGLEYIDTDLDQYASSWVGRLRLSDFLFVVPSLRFLGIALVCGIVVMVSRQYRKKMRAEYLFLLGGIVGVGLNVVVTWSSHINHHQSYIAIMALLIAGASFCLQLPRLIKIGLMFCQSVYVVWVWGFDSILWHGDPNISVLISLVVVVLLLTFEMVKHILTTNVQTSIAPSIPASRFLEN